MNLIHEWFGVEDMRYIILFVPLVIGMMLIIIGHRERVVISTIGGCIFLILFGFTLCWIPMTPDLAVHY